MHHRRPLASLAVVVAVTFACAGCGDDSDDPARSAPPPPGFPAEEPVAAGRTTVVYAPPGAPRREGTLAVPPLRKRTGIVLVHPGGGTGGDRSEMRAWADLYFDLGYLTLSIDYFLYGNRTPSPVYPRPERDVKAAVQYLRRNAAFFGIDGDSIVVHGASAGAHLGGELLTTGDHPAFEGDGHYEDVSDRINGFIGFYGYYDGNVLGASQYYGGPRDSADPEVRTRWARARSIENVAFATGPALLVHGDRDVVPVRFSTRFGDALDAAGKDASVIVVPGADHGFDVDRNTGEFTRAGERAADQVRFWLASRFPDPSP